jgi:hypothetical protein
MKFKGTGMVRWKDRLIANFNTGIPMPDGNFILSVDDPGVIQRLQLCDFEEYTGELPIKEEPKPVLATEATAVPITGDVNADEVVVGTVDLSPVADVAPVPPAAAKPKKWGKKTK